MSSFELYPEFLRVRNGSLEKIHSAIDDFLVEPNLSFEDNKSIKVFATLTSKLLELFAQNYGIFRGSFTDAQLKALLYAKM